MGIKKQFKLIESHLKVFFQLRGHVSPFPIKVPLKVLHIIVRVKMEA